MMNKLANDIAQQVQLKLAYLNNVKQAGLGGALLGGTAGAIAGGFNGGLGGGILGAGVGGIRGAIQKHQAMKNRNFLQKLLNLDAGPNVLDTIKHDAGIGATIGAGTYGTLGALGGGLQGHLFQEMGEAGLMSPTLRAVYSPEFHDFFAKS